jgi:hypothetical protein
VRVPTEDRPMDHYTGWAKRLLRTTAKRIVVEGDLEGLAALDEMKRDIEALMGDTVRELRAEYGYPWSAIGDALGMALQNAQTRFGDKTPNPLVDTETNP